MSDRYGIEDSDDNRSQRELDRYIDIGGTIWTNWPPRHRRLVTLPGGTVEAFTIEGHPRPDADYQCGDDRCDLAVAWDADTETWKHKPPVPATDWANVPMTVTVDGGPEIEVGRTPIRGNADIAARTVLRPGGYADTMAHAAYSRAADALEFMAHDGNGSEDIRADPDRCETNPCAGCDNCTEPLPAATGDALRLAIERLAYAAAEPYRHISFLRDDAALILAHVQKCDAVGCVADAPEVVGVAHWAQLHDEGQQFQRAILETWQATVSNTDATVTPTGEHFYDAARKGGKNNALTAAENAVQAGGGTTVRYVRPRPAAPPETPTARIRLDRASEAVSDALALLDEAKQLRRAGHARDAVKLVNQATGILKNWTRTP